MDPDPLAEREAVRLGAGRVEADLECAVRDPSRLAHQLVEPLLVHGAAALFVTSNP